MHGAMEIQSEHPSDVVEQSRRVVLTGQSSIHRRETMLMWCIGTVFAVAMLILLAAMCLAEIAIHRDASNTKNHASLLPAASEPMSLASSR